MSSCKFLLTKMIADKLQAECIDAIEATDPTRADEIYLRKCTSAPRIGIVVMHFDPVLQEQHRDITAGNSIRAEFDGLKFPPIDSTGGTGEQITGCVEIIENLTKTKEDVWTADEIIQEVCARVKWTLRKYRKDFILIPVDSYGEKIVAFTVIGTIEYDSGAKNSNITRYFIQWLARTYAASPKEIK